MGYKKIKNKTDLIEYWKFNINKQYYFHIYLWKNITAYYSNTPHTIYPIITKEKISHSLACMLPCTCSSFNNKTIIPNKLGEIHFIKNKWNIEIIAHELQHAIIHKIRLLPPYFEDILLQKDNAEEYICYLFGYMMSSIYTKLYAINPIKNINKRITI